MKTNVIYTVMIGCLVASLMACGNKQKSNDIITKTVEMPKPQEPVKLQPYNDSRDVSWIGKQYHVNINRQPSDSLPMVKGTR